MDLSSVAGAPGSIGPDGVFLGIDLAWSAKARTGLAAVDSSGRLLDSAAVVTDDEIASWIDRQPGPVVVAAVDAPLVVPNETGQRVGENQVAKAFGRYGASPYPSNRSNPLFDPPRAATLAERFGWTSDPEHRGTVDSPACIEVYPHPAMVGLFSLPSRILYKKGPARAAGFAALVQHFETLPELRLTENQRWLALKQVVAAPQRGDLTRIEDEIDAILCAHLAWLWHQRKEALHVYGSMAEGYIVAPPPPTHTAELARSRADSDEAVVIEVWGTQPGTSATARGALWRSAIEEACQQFEVLAPGARLSLEVEYAVPERKSSADEWGLDNLLKPTIDGLATLLGRRPGNHPTPQADDERIDRIVATKRRVDPELTVGARIVLRILRAR